jgi:hypothetical protein
MENFLKSLIALVLLAPGQVLSERALKEMRIGDPLPPDGAGVRQNSRNPAGCMR